METEILSTEDPRTATPANEADHGVITPRSDTSPTITRRAAQQGADGSAGQMAARDQAGKADERRPAASAYHTGPEIFHPQPLAGHPPRQTRQHLSSGGGAEWGAGRQVILPRTSRWVPSGPAQVRSSRGCCALCGVHHRVISKRYRPWPDCFGR
jgi:hypothetical protein